MVQGDVLLPNEVIEEIRVGTDLVKLIGESVSLKRSGTNYTGRCPFHDEKTPSFSVSSSKQLYHCFGCGEGGTAITFVMKYFHLPFMDAIERLADRLRIDLSKYKQKQNVEQVEHKRKMFEVLSYAAEKYHSVLDTSFGKKAVEYLAKKRGLTQQMINEFQIGFAPDGWDHMFKALTRDKKSLDAAKQTGLLAKRQKDDGLYDVFRNRIMIPIQNPKGQLVGFGGRSFGDEQPKYLNSPQSDVFDKGRLLYGLPQAEKTIREKDFVILVEGYFDQMALFQNGFKNTVATLGTALTESHAELLKRYTDKIIVVFDGDKAGLKASKRSMGPLLSNGFQAKLVRIPNNQDPDTYVREKGEKAFELLLNQSKSLTDEMIDMFYTQEKNLQTKAEFLEELSEIIKVTKNVYFQEVLLADFAKKTNVDKSRFLQPELKQTFRPTIKIQSKGNEQYVEETTLLRLFVEAPEFREKIASDEVVSLFPQGEFSQAAKLWMDNIFQNSSEENLPAGSYVDRWSHEETKSKLTKVFMETWENKESYFEKTFQDCVAKLRNKQIPRLTLAVQAASNEGNESQVEELLEQIQKYKKVRVIEESN